MLIAQISDTHILAPGKLYRAPVESVLPTTERVYGEFDTAACLARAVGTLNAAVPRPDITLVTGDLVENGEPAQYEHLVSLLAPLQMPVFVIPGNHDAREPLRDAFGGAGYLPARGFLQYTLDDYPLRIVALDTLVPGHHHGMLCAERLGWLDQTPTAPPDRPPVVLIHHPPVS